MENRIFEYKGFIGANYYSYIENAYCGRILWIKKFIAYKNEVEEKLIDNFIKAVDAYISSCKNPKGIENIRYIVLVNKDKKGKFHLYHNELPIALFSDNLPEAKEELVDQMIKFVRDFNNRDIAIDTIELFKIKQFCLFIKDIIEEDKKQIMKTINFMDRDIN